MTKKVHRSAETGEFVTEEFAEENPATTVTETIELDEVPDDLSGMPEATAPAPYRTLLELWRALLEPARSMLDDKISPQWATKIVTSYPEIRFHDTVAVHRGIFELSAQLGDVLDVEIDSDDECLKKANAVEDAEENWAHYVNLLTDWQIVLLREELAWSPSDLDASIKLAVLSEVQQMFLGPQGLAPHLDQIGFQFTDDDRQALAESLQAVRSEFQSEEVEGE